MKLYHNPRCSKSREALQWLTDKGLNPEVVLYMKEPLLPNQLEDLLDKLDMSAIDLVRTKEKIWKEEFADKELTEDELIFCMIEHPQLMERPVLENGDKAKVGRPVENFESIL
jgi:arsenate reductase